jgi:nucleotide-binding universal stress UspA family protein
MTVTSPSSGQADLRGRQLLVAADPTLGGAAALAWAESDLAAAPNARMVIIRCNEPMAPLLGRDEGRELFAPAFSRMVHRSRSHVGGDRVEVAVRADTTASDILATAGDSDTVVLPAPPIGPMHRLMTVAARTRATIVAVRPSRPRPEVTAGVFAGKVLVGIMDGVQDADTIEYSLAYADRHGLAVVAIHAHQPPPSGVWADDDDTPRLLGHQFGLDLLEAAVTAARTRYPDVPVQRVLLQDKADQALARASAGAVLLVVGDRGRGPVARHLIGSTSRRVLRDANCTVAVVRRPPLKDNHSPVPEEGK